MTSSGGGRVWHPAGAAVQYGCQQNVIGRSRLVISTDRPRRHRPSSTSIWACPHPIPPGGTGGEGARRESRRVKNLDENDDDEERVIYSINPQQHVMPRHRRRRPRTSPTTSIIFQSTDTRVTRGCRVTDHIGADFHGATVATAPPRRKTLVGRRPPCEELDPKYDIKFVFMQKITFVLREINKNCCHQSCTFFLQYASNSLSAAASSQTPPGSFPSHLFPYK